MDSIIRLIKKKNSDKHHFILKSTAFVETFFDVFSFENDINQSFFALQCT